MIRGVLRLVLTALAFVTILPMIPGIDFHGNFMSALLISLLFGLMLWLVELLVVFVAALWTVASLGLALLWLIPLWVIGFWVLPALALLLTAHFVPQHLTVTGFFPAAMAGLVVMFIGLLTSKSFKRKQND